MTVLPFDVGTSTEDMAEVVRRYWGFDSLRPLQEEAIRAEIDRRDSLVVLPTGGGKLHLLFLNKRNGRTMVVQTALKTFKWLDGKEQNVATCK